MFFDKLIVKILIIFLAWKFKLPLKAFILTWKNGGKYFSTLVLNSQVKLNEMALSDTFCLLLLKSHQSLLTSHLKVLSNDGKPQQKQQNLIWNVFCLFYCGFKPPRVRKTNLPCQLVHFPRVLTKRSRGKAK